MKEGMNMRIKIFQFRIAVYDVMCCNKWLIVNTL